MSWNPNSVYYACIAKGITILAEFNTKDADLGDLAIKCLHNTPPLHSTFSHTVHGKTYMFFIYDPLVYFGIFHETLEIPECLSFLNSVKDCFTRIVDDSKCVESFTSHCFQGEFSLVFHQLLASNSEFDLASPSPYNLKDGFSGSLDRTKGKKIGSLSFLPDATSEGLKMKKRFFGGESKKGGLTLEVLPDDELSPGGRDLYRLQKAKQMWKKQVIMVLSMDFIFCVTLFVIWLWVCNGFRCVAN